MMGFDPTLYALLRANLRSIPAGEALAHSHRLNSVGEFPFNAFNPRADGRFAGVLAEPRRGGYYAGTSSACALWEADLRNVIGDEQGHVAITPEQVRHRRLSFVRTARPMQILDLTPSALVRMVDDKAIQHRWTALTTAEQHEHTHQPAAALLAQLTTLGVQVDGFAWFSRQCGSIAEHPIVYAFFNPPASSADFVLDPGRASFDLDSPQGWGAIDEALAMAHLSRVSSGASIGSRLAPPSPGDEP